MAQPGGPYSVGDLRDKLPRRMRAAAMARISLVAPASRLAGGAASGGAMQVRTRSAQNVELERRPASVAVPPAGGRWPRDRFVAIGASTGGTQAIEQILRQFPADFPPVVATQHIPVGFSAAFAARLNGCCSMHVEEARDGDILRSGHAYIAPGSRHMQAIESAAGGYAVRLHDGPKIHYQRPAVDELFFSAARLAQGPRWESC
jgi:two-component system chemotaxis response regulator CheB